MEGDTAKILILTLIAVALVVNFFASTGFLKRVTNKPEETSLSQTDLVPAALAWDGQHFWTAHEPIWDMSSPDYQKPGGNQFQAYIFKHNDDRNLSINQTFKAPHQDSIVGMAFIDGDLWASYRINNRQGRIDQYEIREDQLFEKDSWKTELACNGLAWDGVYLWCNMGGTTGLVQFETGPKLTEVKRYPPPAELKALKSEIFPQGLAWDGTSLWSAYKYSYPSIIKHRQDDNLSVEASYLYEDTRLNFYPGDLVFANGALYSCSSDPGTGSERGNRIAKHKLEPNLPVEEIYYYNR